ncbi:hypothetical protein BOTNAR_0060g00310 [Botryotinia narcissicola]|uniref:Uncharacterized protein n=1 Tax=Botryotinia narcissicola TaxID=278944 RepID=A0A4Z1IYJ5_9HELO|nr:hypothetical protein BOTNAR_0060g00310 [Botryotinia narcissicola]
MERWMAITRNKFRSKGQRVKGSNRQTVKTTTQEQEEPLARARGRAFTLTSIAKQTKRQDSFHYLYLKFTSPGATTMVEWWNGGIMKI